ncbi:hypothetical protein G7054_g10149 [Neopestalotiopsis clavispora]|nr:hypothetical protein G7054_g10149 [Neopestalotiopsis clavispora]
MPKSTGSGTMAALSHDGSEDNQCRFDQHSKMLLVGSLEEMERHVKVACKIINHINLAVISCGAATDAQSTGAGNSSVINAILDEERIVPTNCFRACTAVITELAWNDSEIPGERYRSEFEFIRPEDWATELRQLQGDLIDSKGQTTTDAPEDDTNAEKLH